jgi:hypothetical protein
LKYLTKVFFHSATYFLEIKLLNMHFSNLKIKARLYTILAIGDCRKTFVNVFQQPFDYLRLPFVLGRSQMAGIVEDLCTCI